MKKFYVDKNHFKNDMVLIDGDEFHHLSKVLRTVVNEKIQIVCGDDYIYNCEVCSIEKHEATAKVLSKEFCHSNPKIVIDIFQGLPKGEKLEVLVQKLTELGANKIIPFESEHTIAKNNPIKMERLNKISKQACKQCGRSIPLEINSTISLMSIKQYLENYDLVIFLYEKAVKIDNITRLTSKIQDSKKIAIIVGSEGGFSEKESDFLSKLQTEKIWLGNRILRTETASIALVAHVSLLTNN